MFCRELNKEFADKSEMLKAIIENKQLIIDSKKAEIRDSDNFIATVKGDATKAEQSIGSMIYPVINTTNYMDSHGDVHAKGIWSKTVSEQSGKLYYVMDHNLDVNSVISYPKNVNPIVQSMSWNDLGFDYKGNTDALIYEVTLTGSEPQAFTRALYEGNLQNSVRMQYINILLCMEDTEYEQERNNWNKYIKEVVNRELAEQVGYFWYVTEAKIVKEGSAVLFGSNDATPILRNLSKKQEPTQVTPNINKGVTNKNSNYYYTL